MCIKIKCINVYKIKMYKCIKLKLSQNFFTVFFITYLDKKLII